MQEEEVLEKVIELIGSILKTIIDVNSSEEYIELDNSIIFDAYNKELHLANFESMHVVKYCEWFDGSNRKVEVNDYAESILSETSLVINEDDVLDLDEWDGNNHTTGGVGNHQHVHKIIEEDGENVEDKYLIVFSSQWQGEDTKGSVVNKEELIAHLKELGRDIEEYKKYIEELG